MHIETILARELLDSRGTPTVEAEIILNDGISASAMVPSGASTGSKEALEKRDGDSRRYRGLGVQQVCEVIQDPIAAALHGMDVTKQKEIDRVLCDLDGTSNKSRLGANTLLAVSLAAARAASYVTEQPLFSYLAEGGRCELPRPLINIINGGAHANNGLSIQEFMIIPVSPSTFSDVMVMASSVFVALKQLLKEQNMSIAVGDEGGVAPVLANTRSALDLVMTAITQAGLKPGHDVVLALDCASSEFYRDEKYHLQEEQLVLDSESMVSYLEKLVQDYPIVSIEDGCAEDDWQGWQLLTERLGHRCQLVGDDLFVTQANYLQQGIDQNAANAILIKLNQVGTLTETLNTIALARLSNFATVISHRSGETEDSFIADLAVATAAGQIKTGSMCRQERMAKYNQLLRIEYDYGKQVPLAMFKRRLQ